MATSNRLVLVPTPVIALFSTGHDVGVPPTGYQFIGQDGTIITRSTSEIRRASYDVLSRTYQNLENLKCSVAALRPRLLDAITSSNDLEKDLHAYILTTGNTIFNTASEN